VIPLLLLVALTGQPSIAVSRTEGLPAAGETVVVTGQGFDPAKGVYVAFCVDRGPGARPTPCGGGADTTGTSGGSQWVSSDPPPYGRGLTVPYGPGGTFRVELRVSARIGEYDCREVRCAIVTRADHTRTDDRSQDTRIPVTFADGAGPPAVALAGAGAGAAGIGAAAVLLAGRRRRRRA
jgi:hypothetical protein